jgi:hypothetical protein
MVTTSESPNVAEPIQLVVNPSQLVVNPSQLVVNPSQLVVNPSQLFVDSSEVPAEPSRSLPESPQVPTEVAVMQPGFGVTSIPPQTTMNIAAVDPAPKVQYRVRNPATTVPGTPSRRGSIDGAPEMLVDPHVSSEIPSHQASVDNDTPEVVVDLSDYINDSDEESHVSSSQKTSDGCQELPPPPPPPSSQRQQEEAMNQPSGPTRTYPQLNVEEGDLPIWMVKKGQWKYLASTAGGPTWERLLKVYMLQERRLEFREMVSNLAYIFPTSSPNRLQGANLTHEGRPSKIKEYFQYAHKPSRGNTLTVPSFGTEVIEWWGNIQPEWRRAEQDPPLGPGTWSYILSGGSKGVFLVLMCLAWWDHAYARYLEEEMNTRRRVAEVAGAAADFGDLPGHNMEWLKIVDDLAFVMEKAQVCDIPGREMQSPSGGVKRKRETESVATRKKAVRASSSKKSKA